MITIIILYYIFSLLVIIPMIPRHKTIIQKLVMLLLAGFVVPITIGIFLSDFINKK